MRVIVGVGFELVTTSLTNFSYATLVFLTPTSVNQQLALSLNFFVTQTAIPDVFDDTKMVLKILVSFCLVFHPIVMRAATNFFIMTYGI